MRRRGRWDGEREEKKKKREKRMLEEIEVRVSEREGGYDGKKKEGWRRWVMVCEREG